MLSFYYFVGGTLEREWGTAKFTLYYLCGMVLSILSTIILSLATGYYGWSLSDAYYINLTLFLAFAALYTLVYRITSNAYYHIVSGGGER